MNGEFMIWSLMNIILKLIGMITFFWLDQFLWNWDFADQVTEENLDKSLSELGDAVSALGDLIKSTPKRKADPKSKAAASKAKKTKKA